MNERIAQVSHPAEAMELTKTFEPTDGETARVVVHSEGGEPGSSPRIDSMSAHQQDLGKEFQIRMIRTKIDKVVRDESEVLGGVEFGEAAMRLIEEDAQRQYEAVQRLRSLEKSLAYRAREWYMQLEAAAKDVYPAKELPTQWVEFHLGGSSWERHRFDYKLDYKVKGSSSERVVERVDSLKIRNKENDSFNVDFACHAGKVNEVTLYLPPNGLMKNHVQERKDMALTAGGSLGVILESVNGIDGPDKLKFVFGDNDEVPAVVLAKSRLFGKDSEIRCPYQAENDAFQPVAQKPPGNERGTAVFRGVTITREMFFQATEQLYGIVPYDIIK